MAQVTESIWTLPLNPPNFQPFYLRSIVAKSPNLVYYTKYIVDIFGELDVAKNQIREWRIPPAVYKPSPVGSLQGICLGPGGTVWGALTSVGCLAELRPKDGRLRVFGTGVSGPIGVWPRQVQFDGTGKCWFAGAGKTGPRVGRLDPQTGTVQTWDLPGMALDSAWDLYVEQTGKAVWCTLYNTQSQATPVIPFLARLDPAASMFEYYTLPEPILAGPSYAGARGLVADAPSDPANIWLAYEDPDIGWQVIRFDLAKNAFFFFAKPASAFFMPKFLALLQGVPWYSDAAGSVSRVRALSCGAPAQPLRHTAEVPVKASTLKPKTGKLEPKTTSAPPQQSTVTAAQSKCFIDVPMPIGFNPGWLTMDGDGNVYAAEDSGGRILAFKA